MKFKLIILLILGIWSGMVLGISFIEAPLKFQAPNITLTLGLGIGQLVFGALNKVELVFSFLLLGLVGYQYQQLDNPVLVIISLLIGIIAIQSIWLFPILDARIDALQQGLTPAKTNHHFYYVALEILKVGGLIYGFIKIYKHAGHSR
ncbi:MAG: hypothetical protein AB8G86_06375 [Saprospiraceae bacterium]